MPAARPRRADLEKVVNGRMIRVWRRRSAVEAFVWPGDTADGEPQAEWVFPISLRYDLDIAVHLADVQTERK